MALDKSSALQQPNTLKDATPAGLMSQSTSLDSLHVIEEGGHSSQLMLASVDSARTAGSSAASESLLDDHRLMNLSSELAEASRGRSGSSPRLHISESWDSVDSDQRDSSGSDQQNSPLARTSSLRTAVRSFVSADPSLRTPVVPPPAVAAGSPRPHYADGKLAYQWRDEHRNQWVPYHHSMVCSPRPNAATGVPDWHV